MNSTTNPNHSVSILLVEDTGVTIDLLSIIIPKHFPDADLFTAINGKKGLDLFKMYMQDIVITDINMPEMSGLQMAEKIRAIKPDTKFIFITGDTEKIAMEVSSGNHSGINPYIAKPVKFEVLYAAIEQYIGEIAQQNRSKNSITNKLIEMCS
jgi:YesN/AraC family two-component response regulator